jgi:hypothetical protein
MVPLIQGGVSHLNGDVVNAISCDGGNTWQQANSAKSANGGNLNVYQQAYNNSFTCQVSSLNQIVFRLDASFTNYNSPFYNATYYANMQGGCAVKPLYSQQYTGIFPCITYSTSSPPILYSTVF